MKQLYFEWIMQLVGNHREYESLMLYLISKNYTYTNPMDGNREADGIELRYRFGYENMISSARIAAELDICPCSILEMMVALAARANTIITDTDEEVEFIFSSMILSLGLDNQTNSRFNKSYCDMRIASWLNSEYQPDGKGGLITLQNPPRDLRHMEIWDQMCGWLSENYSYFR